MQPPERDFWYSDPDPDGGGQWVSGPPACYFWDGVRCHYEMLVTGIGGPCADCPDEDERFATLQAESLAAADLDPDWPGHCD